MFESKLVPFLEGERLYIRPMEEIDLPYFHENLWDPEIRRLTGSKTVFTKTALKSWFDSKTVESNRIDCIICLKDNHQTIGDVAMINIDHINKGALVRIAINQKEYLGKGFGTEALRLLLDYGFSMLNLHRIGLDVYSFNERGIKSYEKLGFQVEGRIRDELFYDGEYHDSILMGVLKDEFYETANKK